MDSVLNADVVCWATPIYYYEMSGQMKTLIDRMNAMYPKDYRFRDIYLLTTAAEDEESTPKRGKSQAAPSWKRHTNLGKAFSWYIRTCRKELLPGWWKQ